MVCVWEGPPYLNYNSLDAGHVCLPWGVLLHFLAWRMQHGQNARVRCEDDAAGQDVAEDEECQRVGACCWVLIGQAPVDATGSAVRFRSILAPAGQRWAGEQQSIDPSAGDEQAAMSGVKPVPCEKTAALSLNDIKWLIWNVFIYGAVFLLIKTLLHFCFSWGQIEGSIELH